MHLFRVSRRRKARLSPANIGQPVSRIPHPKYHRLTVINLTATLRSSRVLCLAACTVAVSAAAQQRAATEYKFSFPDVVHHVVNVDATFHTTGSAPLTLHMSRSSPGRYAAFEFVSNVFEEKFTNGAGKPLEAHKTDPRTWVVSGSDGTVHVTYKLFGDRVDGTFMAIDSTHAHFNWPATVLWADGWDLKPWKLSFDIPSSSNWKIATQLYPTANSNTFTAPNLQYLMDSPAELSDFALHTFTVNPINGLGKPQTIRVAAHSLASEPELKAYFAGAEKIVREEQAVFGELPEYEPGTYTFLSDALPWDNGDGMEHRNSTVITGTSLNLGTVAHEYFHNWNVERIRPQGLEPFNFRDINMSYGMFIAEGFTQYYGQLAMVRSGLSTSLQPFIGEISQVINTPGTQYRSAADMSRMAPLVDGASDLFPTYFNNTFVSYYTFGAVVAMGLDLELRARSNGKVSLDDFERAMWLAYGKPKPSEPGLVTHPYTIEDVQTQIAKVSGDPAFAADFVKRYMLGTDKIDYAPLLLKAGYILKAKGTPTLGRIAIATRGTPGRRGAAPTNETLRVVASTTIGSPAYNAGLDLDDELLSVGGVTITSTADIDKAIANHKVGDTVELVFKRRGQQVKSNATLAPDPALEITPVENPTAEQKTFREAWLGSKAK